MHVCVHPHSYKNKKKKKKQNTETQPVYMFSCNSTFLTVYQAVVQQWAKLAKLLAKLAAAINSGSYQSQN